MMVKEQVGDEIAAVHECLLLLDLTRALKLLPILRIVGIQQLGGSGFISGEIREGRDKQLWIAAGLRLPVLAEATAFERE